MPNLRTSISQPLPIFIDRTGNPLQDGVIYVGPPDKNPEEFQIPVYENKSDLTPLSQPIRTFSGQPAIDERIIQLYIDQDYSITVRTQDGELIYRSIVTDAIPASTAYVLATLQDYVTRALLDINLADYALIANVHNVPPGGDTSYVLTKTSPADYAIAWLPAGTATGTLPPGGTVGQFLQKADVADYVTEWVTLDLSVYALSANIHNLPSGGTTGQFLVKSSNTDYDVTWQTLSTSQPYDTGGFYPGSPTASAIVYFHVFARSVTFPANFAGALGYAGTVATATKTYIINKVTSSGTVTAIGTMVWTAGSHAATFATTGSTSFSASDMLQVVADATTDTTLANITFTFAGTR